MKKTVSKFVLSRAGRDRKQFRFKVVSNNGEVVATSETYKTRAMAKKGIDALVQICLIGILVDNT